MRKMLKSKKGLSPVVAAIILIAVTVAVSIAVAAWMGALTFTFMATEEVSITSMSFTGAGASITVQVKNTGTAKVTITEAVVTPPGDTIDITDTSIDAGDTGSITITLTQNWTAGQKYKVTLLSSSGKNVAAYEKTA
jgi:flagellin-like protein